MVKGNEYRKRSGCWTCKDKHVQCTEEKPACSRCSRLDLKCAYGIRLLWKEDAIQRNISLGREGKWSKSSKIPKSTKSVPGKRYRPINISTYIDRWIFLNITENDFNGGSDGSQEMDGSSIYGEAQEVSWLDGTISPENVEDCHQAELQLILYPNCSNQLSSYSSIEGNLFQYFVSSIGPNCSLSPSKNPYLNYLTPMSFQFPSLNNALLAVSANQLRLLNDRRFEKQAFLYKSRAIQGVQVAIDTGQITVGVVATVLMLCFYDISDGCNKSWLIHLRGGLSLLDKLPLSMGSQRESPKEDDIHAFLRMYVIAHEIMSRTSCDHDLIERSPQWSEEENLDEIDILMGCSRRLMNLIGQISTINTDIDNIISFRDNIERSLHSLQQTLPSGINQPSDLSRIAETKRLTALFYLRDRLDTQTLPPTSLTSSENDKSASTTYRSQLITSIITLLESLPDSSTLLWPLFMLGNTRTSSLDEVQRRFVHERLTALQKVRNLGSVKRARVMVEMAWKKTDLGVGIGPAGLEYSRRGGVRTRHLISLA